MFELALTFFLVANPIGNSPNIIAVVKDFEFQRQRLILFREGLFALLIALFFQYFGMVFLTMLAIQSYALTIAGGILLSLVAFNMIFLKPPAVIASKANQEPFIVPIATPIISGPGLLAMIMLYSETLQDPLTMSMAILIAWIGIMAVLSVAPYLQVILGKRGLTALQQVMGMILTMIACQMLVTGLSLFIKTL